MAIPVGTSCHALGEAILRVKGIAVETVATWGNWMPHWIRRWLTACPDDPRQAFAFAVETPFWLPHLLRALGRFEVLWTLAQRKDVCDAEFIQADKPVIMMKGFGDPLIPFHTRVLSSIRLGGGSSSGSASGSDASTTTSGSIWPNAGAISGLT